MVQDLTVSKVLICKPSPDRKLVEAPPSPLPLLLAVPRRLLCFVLFFGDFRCGVSLFIVSLVIYK